MIVLDINGRRRLLTGVIRLYNLSHYLLYKLLLFKSYYILNMK